MNRTDFKVGTKKKLIVTGESIYVIPIPEFMYKNGATRFENINKESARAVVSAAGLELILFTLNVIYNRINDPVASWKTYPVSVYLEALVDRNKSSKIVEHRLVVVEHADAEVSFSDVFAEAWQNVRYPLLPDGTFFDPEKNAKRGAKTTKTNPSQEFNIYELFKYIHDKEALTILCGTMLGISMTQDVRRRLCTDRPINDKDNFLHPKKQFHIRHAFKGTSPSVCDSQRRIDNYYCDRHDRVQLTFPNQEVVFRIIPQFWNVTRFMSRIFPCLQENKLDVKWSKHMREVADNLERMEAEHARRTQMQKRAAEAGLTLEDSGSTLSTAKRRRVDVKRNASGQFVARGGGGGGDDDDDEDEEEFGMDDFNRLHSGFAAINAGGIGVGPDTDNDILAELGPDAGGDAGNGGFSLETFGNVREMTEDEREDNRALLGMADGYQGRTDIFLDDFIGLGMKMPFREAAALLKKLYGDDPKEFIRQMNTLKDVTFDKFDRYCTGEFNVSATQAKLNKYWADNNLQDFHFELPITDPTLSTFDNFVIWMTESAGLYEGIATNQALFAFIWLNMNSIFDRSPTVHTNMYIHGDAGVGKTYIADRAMHSCLRETIEDVTSESELYNTVNATSSDNCCFNEDASIRRFFAKGDGADARKRYEMSAQKTIRKVLEYVEDEWGNKVRKTMTYVNKAPTTFVDCGNENEGDLGSDLITSKDALVSRYIFVYVRQHNNPARRIGDPLDPIMSVDEFRRINIKAHCIRGWYAKLADIMEGYNHIDMQAFENCVPLLRSEMRSLGLDYSSNRTEYMMKKYAMGCAILEQYLIHHCTPLGMFFGKPFKVSMMRKWTPKCTVNIVIHTFGRFVDSYIPPALHYTLKFLKNRVNSCIDDYSKKIRFPGKFVGKPDPTHAVYGGNLDLAVALPQGRHQGGKGGRGGGGGGGGGAVGGGKGGVGNNPFFLQPVDLQMRNPLLDDDGFGGDGDDADSDVAAGPKEFDGTFVRFGDESFRSLSEMIHVSSRNENVIYSSASIEQCLVALKSLSVFSHKYIFLSQDEKLPVVKDDVPVGFHEAGAKHSKYGVLINYGLVCEGGMYEDIVGHVIKALEFDKTPRQDFLSGVPDENYPWLYTRVSLNPRPGRRMILRNPRYVSDYALVSVTGSFDRSILPKDRNYTFNGFDVDMDTHCIMSALRMNNPIREISLEVAMQLHPLVQQKNLMLHYKHCIDIDKPSPVTGQLYNFVRYPSFARLELDKIRTTTQALADGNIEVIDMDTVQRDVWIGNNKEAVTGAMKEKISGVMQRCFMEMDNAGAAFIAEAPGDNIYKFQKARITDGTEEGVRNEDVVNAHYAAVVAAQREVANIITEGIPNFMDEADDPAQDDAAQVLPAPEAEDARSDKGSGARSGAKSGADGGVFEMDDDESDDESDNGGDSGGSSSSSSSSSSSGSRRARGVSASETLQRVLRNPHAPSASARSSESRPISSAVVDIDDDGSDDDGSDDNRDGMDEDSMGLPGVDDFMETT